MNITCPQCGFSAPSESYFCPNCGKQLKKKAPSTSVMAQIGIYALSIFFPPFGLWPAVKYLRQPDNKSKWIGIIAVVLNVASLAVAVWSAELLINPLNQSLGSLSGLGL